jgi:hypothetical protein
MTPVCATFRGLVPQGQEKPSLAQPSGGFFRACEFVRSKPLSQLEISRFACCGYAADNSSQVTAKNAATDRAASRSLATVFRWNNAGGRSIDASRA